MAKKSIYSNWMAVVSHLEPFSVNAPDCPKKHLLADKKRIGLIRGLCCTQFLDSTRDDKRKKAIIFLSQMQDMEFFLRYLNFGLTWFTDNIDSLCPSTVDISPKYVDEMGIYGDEVKEILDICQQLWPPCKF